MAKKTLNMEMGNLICRFGQNKVLLDLAEEIVFPSFFDKKLSRSYDKTSFFFDDVNFVNLNNNDSENVIGIAGRFIKDTTLKREQVYEKGKGLIKDVETMRSSPSAIFLLILNYHRLIYVKETADAPSKESFGSTLLTFLREKRRCFIDSEYDRYRSLIERMPPNELDLTSKNLIERLNTFAGHNVIDCSQDRNSKFIITKKKLQEIFPNPTLELIPLPSTESIEEFVKKYDVLKVLEISPKP